jgi:hypothetical protein
MDYSIFISSNNFSFFTIKRNGRRSLNTACGLISKVAEQGLGSNLPEVITVKKLGVAAINAWDVSLNIER